MPVVGKTRGTRSYQPLEAELVLFQLRSTPLFGGCSDAELAAVAAHSAERRFAVGEALARQGTRACEVPIVLDGYAGAEVDGVAAVVLGAGAVIGGPEALDGALHPMTVIAQTPVVTRVIAAPDFATLVAGVPPLAVALIRQLGGRTRTVLDELVCARQGSVTPGLGSIAVSSSARSSNARRSTPIVRRPATT